MECNSNQFFCARKQIWITQDAVLHRDTDHSLINDVAENLPWLLHSQKPSVITPVKPSPTSVNKSYETLRLDITCTQCSSKVY